MGPAGSTVSHFRRSARPAGFEPATRCLEGSCSVRLSYGRPNVIVQGQDHVTATRRSQCVGPLAAQIRPCVRQQPTVPEPAVNDASHAKPQAPQLRIRTNPAS